MTSADNNTGTYRDMVERSNESLEFNLVKSKQTDFFSETKSDQIHNSNNITTLNYDCLNNICLCMIDIVGFSSWCSNHVPYIIAKSMVDYNSLICKSIRKYPSLKKIELVGDCCMIISAFNPKGEPSNCLDTIRFAIDIISQLQQIRNIFKSKSIGVRIGIHVGDVIGVYIENPDKYQLFGNDINVCSRLESSTKPNTIHISEKTIMCIQELLDPREDEIRNLLNEICIKCIKGNSITQSYKGVGSKTSYIYYLKVDKILLLHFNNITYPYFTKKLDSLDTNISFEMNLDDDNVNYENFKYVCVFISLLNVYSFDNIKNILNRLVFKHKDDQQMGIQTLDQITTILCSNVKDEQYINQEYPFMFNNVFCITDESCFTKCKQIIYESRKLFDKKRGSFDLYVD